MPADAQTRHPRVPILWSLATHKYTSTLPLVRRWQNGCRSLANHTVNQWSPSTNARRTLHELFMGFINILWLSAGFDWHGIGGEGSVCGTMCSVCRLPYRNSLRIMKMRLRFATRREKVLASFATHTFAAIGSTFFSRIAEKAITGVRRTRALSVYEFRIADKNVEKWLLFRA